MNWRTERTVRRAARAATRRTLTERNRKEKHRQTRTNQTRPDQDRTKHNKAEKKTQQEQATTGNGMKNQERRNGRSDGVKEEGRTRRKQE